MFFSKKPWRYGSGEEFFQAFKDLADRIEQKGDADAARDLREGFACLNGLTDGWAMLMEAIEKTIAEHGGRLDPADMDELKEILTDVKRIVYGRR